MSLVYSPKRMIKLFLDASHQPIVMLSIINILVALVAFVKDIMLAAYVGTNLHADALTLAFFLPDSFGNNMFASAITIGCIPIFSRIAALEQYDRLRSSAKYISIRFIVISFIVMTFAYGFSELITTWLNGSDGVELEQATLPLLRVMLPSTVLFVVIALGTSILQTLRRFTVPALTPLLFNFIFLLGIVACSVLGVAVENGVTWIAMSIMLGVCLMAIWIVVVWYKTMSRLPAMAGLKTDNDKVHVSSDWKQMIQIFAPYIVILFSLQAIYLAERYIITAFDSGAASALNYAFRLSQLPIWVFVAAISVVILPSLSKHLALGQQTEAGKVMVNAFRAVILIVVPCMLILFLLREPLTIALFQRGAFDARSVDLTTSILEGYSLSVLCQSISLVCLRYFLANKRLIAVLMIYASSALVTIAFDFWFTQFMGPRGIGYGATLGALLNATLLLFLLYRRLRPSLRLIVEELRLYSKTAILPVLFFAVSGLVWRWMPAINSTQTMIFVGLTLSIFLLSYYYVIRRFWPNLFAPKTN
jgi:putative peptidoglycan lipid II flippase